MAKNTPTNAGDLGSIPGSKRSPGGGSGNLLQYSCLEHSMDRGAWYWQQRNKNSENGTMSVSPVAQLVKKKSACNADETWVRSLGWEDTLEKGTATYSNILAWRIPGLYSPWGHKESDTTE